MVYIRFDDIGKRFPGVTALDGVSFAIERGHCHALLGENGAGKSTLGKILAGVHRADSGTLWIDGTVARIAGPRDACAHGVAMVHQELAFCPNLSIAENLCLADLPLRHGLIDRAAMRTRASTLLAELGVVFDVDRLVGTLTPGQEQLVQIAAAIGGAARIIVMDEPTSSLSAGETQRLYELVGRLKARGVTIIYVSHRLEEIIRLCDAVTVLRDGRHVETRSMHGVRQDDLVRLMVGRDVALAEPEHLAKPRGPVRLTVSGLTSPGRFRDVSFRLHAGEIVGVAGLVGAGRSEVAQAIMGLDPEVAGSIVVAGVTLTPHSIDAAMAAGVGLVPEDRKHQGLVLGLSCRTNVSLAVLDRLSRFGFVDRAREERLVATYRDRLRVKTASLDTLAAVLSGGNQQKLALAKWLACDCRVLIVDEPTRGVDIGAKVEIHRLLDQLAAEGLAVLMISSDLPEVLALSRRVLVMRGGGLVAELTRAEANEESVMRAMAGAA